MGKKAGVISIDINAGTAQFLVDMDKANAKFASFGKAATTSGHATVSSMQASSAAIRLLENPMGNNIRAVERFISLLPGAGKLLQDMFLGVGALATIDLGAKLGAGLYSFFQKIEEAPRRIATAFRELNAPLQLTNDELELSNKRMENTIAKLEGRKEDRLGEALLEAKDAADKLADSLDKDLEKMLKVLNAETHGSMTAIFHGQTPTSDIREDIEKFQFQVAEAHGDAEKLKKLYADKVEEYAQKAHDTADGYGIGGFLGEDKHAMLVDAYHYFQSEQEHIQGVQTQGVDQRHLASAQDNSAGRKAALEETARLTKELGDARAVQAGAMERIDIEETNELQHLMDINQFSKKNVDLVHEIYDAKRVAEYNKLMQETVTLHLSLAGAMKNITTEEAAAAVYGPQFAGAVKEMEGHAKAAAEWAKEYNRITEETNLEGQRHGVAIVGATAGSSTNPRAILDAEQKVRKDNIDALYAQKMAVIDINDVKAKSIAIDQHNLDLLKLQNEYEERVAQLRQQKIDQAIDTVSGDVSSNLTKLLTGEHTSWGKDAQQAGRSIIQSTIKSALQHGIKHAIKPSGIASDPIYANIVNWPGMGPNPISSLPGAGQLPPALGGSAAGLGGFFRGLLHALTGSGGGSTGLTEAVSSSISFGGFLADGGDVMAGNNYVVGDGGEPEIFSPGMNGKVTPVSKLGGGDTHYYSIDARGTDPALTEMRVRQAIVAAHNSAVATSVRAGAERAKRTVAS